MDIQKQHLKNFGIFLLPTIILYCLIMIYPLLNTVYLGFFTWNGIGAKSFAGFANFREMFFDPIFWKALENNLLWILLSIVNPMFVGLIISVLLSNITRGQKLYSAIFFIPVVLSLVTVSLVWGLMYNPIIGPVNKIIVAFGGPPIGWLGDPRTVSLAIILAGNWTYFGFCTIIFLAGLQNIEDSIIEAAIIDGASGFRRFFSIIIPNLINQVNLLVIYSIIGSFKVFDIIYNMTFGGPNHSSEVIATYMYWEAFKNGRVGYGSALSTVLTVVVGAFSIVYLKTMEEKA